MDAHQQEIDSTVKKALQLAKELEVSDKWQEVDTEPCLMYSMEVDDRVAAKGIATAPFSIKDIVTFLTPAQNYFKFMESLKVNDLIHESNGIRVFYQVHKGMGPVSDRDFVCAGIVEPVGDNKLYMVIRSCDYPHKGEEGPVRGEMHLGAYIMEALGEKETKFTYISDFDLKGMIPGFIKNSVTKAEGKMAHTMIECMKKEGVGK